MKPARIEVSADDEAIDRLSPEQLRRVVRGGAVVAVALAGGLAWSLAAVPPSPVAEVEAPLVASPEARAPTPSPTAPMTPATPVAARRSAVVSPPRLLPELLRLQLGFLRPNQMVGTIAFGEVVRGTPSAKLINLWATWCAPCVREIDMFRALSDGWERDVQFVPIHIGAVHDNELYHKLVRAMPRTAEEPLIDASGEALQGLLRGVGLLDSGEGIPITLLLDCRNALRWIHVGELADTVELSKRLDVLRSELASPRCAPPAPVAAVTPVPPGCGDGICGAPEESCANCTADCGCSVSSGAECLILPGEPPHCGFPPTAFSNP